MTTQLKNELLFGGRFLFRDNPALAIPIAAELANNALMPPEELAIRRQRYLHASLQRAIDQLPFYAQVPRDFSAAESEQVLREHFPIIDKATLLEHRTTLYPNGGVKRLWHAAGKTSGTTGTPLTILRSARSVVYENEFIKRHWSWGGYKPGMKRATLRGDLVVPIDQARPPFWFWNRYNQQLLLSSRHLTDDHADAIIDRLEEYGADMLQAYPSTAYTLAQYLARRGRKLRIPVVFTASEPVYPHQREAILEWLGVRIMDMYGQAERVAFATECEHGGMHLNTDYSHVELVDGFVVGTTYHNDTMPLVRYRLSDQTCLVPGCCACGRPFPLIAPVTGKYEDSITGSGGKVISPSVLTFAFKGVEHIKRSQVAQVGPAHWEVRLVPEMAFTATDQQRLVDNIHKLVDPQVKVNVVLRRELANTAAGKFRWVVNET